MSPIRNARVIFNSIPTGYPEPGKTVVYDDSQTIDIEKVPLNGGFLVKTLVLSIDPYMRGRMRPPEVESYASAWIIGEPCNGYGVGVVVRSECNNVKAGDHVYGPSFQHQEYFVMKSLDERTRILENKEDLPWYVYVGAAGMPGKTAFAGWKEYSKAKKGDIVFVTAGGGPVGLMVIQLAKKDGLKVIASAGSQEKIDLMKQAGADVTFNYKTTSTEEVLQKEGPVNIYWDNVGGETLDAALKHAAFFARFIECGMISGYNQRPKPIENIDSVFTRSISMNGFIVWNLELKYDDEFYRTVPPKLASGEFKHREEVFKGLDKVGDVILLGQKGLNKAKTVVLVAEE